MAKIIAEIDVCEDCMFVHANGETGNETPDREPWGLLPGADVGMGDAGEDGDGEGFSWSRCTACGTTLGGNRYRFAVFSWGPDNA